MRQIKLLTPDQLTALIQECLPLLRQAQLQRSILSHHQTNRIEKLFEQINLRLYRFALKRCGSAEIAHDLTQEALIVILRRLPELGQELPLLPWSFGVIRKLCLKHNTRKAYQSTERSFEELQESNHHLHFNVHDTPEEVVTQMGKWEEVARAIQTLDPIYREVLLLRDVEGLSASETALAVDATVSAVKSRLHRARSELRVALTSHTLPPPLPEHCPDIRRVFSEHLEGDLKPSLCTEMENHVRSCIICTRECDELKATLTICSTSPASIPQELAEQLRAQMNAWLDDHSEG